MNDSFINQSPKKPVGHITNDNWLEVDFSNMPPHVQEDVDTVQQLLDHLAMIRELEEQMDAIDWLSKNAEDMAENPKYTSDDTAIINAIQQLGASGNEVNFELYKYAIEIILEGYRQMSIVALGDVVNGY